MPKLLERTCVALLGLLAVILFLEAGLRGIGLAGSMRRSDVSGAPDGVRTVLCLGDSYTYCPGVAADETYPSRLQAVLNEGRTTPAWRVVNLGANGQSTATLAAEVEKDLDTVQPDVVVLLTGGANVWDEAGYDAWRKQPKKAWFDRIRLVQLVRLARCGVTPEDPSSASASPPAAPAPCDPVASEALAAARPLTQARRHAEVVATLEPVRALAFVCPSLATVLGLAYMEVNRYDDALTMHLAAVTGDPDDAAAYDHLGQTYRVLGRPDDAVDAWIGGLGTPDTEKNAFEKPRIQAHLEALCALDGGTACARARVQADDSRTQTDETSDRMAWVRSDVLRIAEASRERGVPVLVLNYPRALPAGWEALPETLAATLDLPFVDVRAVFEALPDETPYFLPDGHCNARGNDLVARTVAPTLLGLWGE